MDTFVLPEMTGDGFMGEEVFEVSPEGQAGEPAGKGKTPSCEQSCTVHQVVSVCSADRYRDPTAQGRTERQVQIGVLPKDTNISSTAKFIAPIRNSERGVLFVQTASFIPSPLCLA